MRFLRNKLFRNILSVILIITTISSNVVFERVQRVYGEEISDYTTVYFKDQTDDSWIGNDGAIMQLVDNTNGHIYYIMKQVDDNTWSCKVPADTYNVTFNRLNPATKDGDQVCDMSVVGDGLLSQKNDNYIQWNSWSAGGRDSNNTYFAEGAEYGHWESASEENKEKYFHVGDIIYLDLTEFTAWKTNNARMYINLNGISKQDNDGKDVNIAEADKSKYSPKLVDTEVSENVYAYVISLEDEGTTELRFWRGNDNSLWNCSVKLTYEDYSKGLNCVKIKDWNDTGEMLVSKYEMDIASDSDGDGLADYYEMIIGTDKNKLDTDSDGLNDYDELALTGSDPCIYDSIELEISDGLIDLDEDGIDNQTEVKYGTNPLITDTDSDGLDDRIEIVEYKTNPLSKDTDNDNLEDDSELKFGTDPLDADTNENGILDGDEIYNQVIDTENFEESIFDENVAIPSISVNEKGDASKTTYVEEYDGYLKGDDREYVGKCIEVSGSEAESGNISFTLSNEYSIPSYTYEGITTNGLLICVNIDEETIPLETSYNEETRELTTEFAGNGVYFVLDTIKWMKSLDVNPEEVIDDIKTESGYESVPALSCVSLSAFCDKDVELEENEISNDTEPIQTGLQIAGKKVSGQVDIVFVVDTTGSMQNSINNVKSNIKSFVDTIEAANIKPYFSIVEYKDITCDGTNSTNVKINKADNSCWFSSAEEFKIEISKLSANGGGDTPETAIDGLEFARQLNMRTNSQKFFILVTDANYKIDNNYSIESMDEMIDLLVGDNINTSVITSNTYRNTYENLYETTGGIFANINGSFGNELLGIAKKIIDFTNNGTWIALNGLVPEIVKLEAEPAYGSKTDTDKDDLTDIDELGSATPVKKYNVAEYASKLTHYTMPFNTYISDKYDIYVYNYNSNPVKEDTDGDGLLDGKSVTIQTADSTDGEVVTPKDNQPKVQNGDAEIWKYYRQVQSDGWVQDDYGDGYGAEVGVNKFLADCLVNLLLKNRKNLDTVGYSLRNQILAFKEKIEGDTVLGAYLLNFIYDNKSVAYHSQPDTWQREFGYNDFYDDVFDFGSNMKKGRYIFDYNGKDYALWMWKGDYWNLQSGAEIGLYTYDRSVDENDQYDAVDFEIPMELALFNKYSDGSIDCLFNWKPTDPQWWVTGFNPKYKNANPDIMTSIGKLNFEGNKELYLAMKNGWDIKEKNNYKDIKKENIIFDDENYCVWVVL